MRANTRVCMCPPEVVEPGVGSVGGGTPAAPPGPLAYRRGVVWAPGPMVSAPRAAYIIQAGAQPRAVQRNVSCHQAAPLGFSWWRPVRTTRPDVCGEPRASRPPVPPLFCPYSVSSFFILLIRSFSFFVPSLLLTFFQIFFLSG